MKQNPSEPFDMLAKTFAGLEPALAQELKQIGASDIIIGRRMVSFKGNTECMYKANVYLRTALRVLKPIYKGIIKTPEDYYNFFHTLEWEKYMGLHHTFAIDAVINTKVFNNSLYAAQRAKDGIADRFKDKYNKRPNVDVQQPEILINVHYSGEELSIALDSSGEPLNKRGYRVGEGEAPLNPVLAAAMIIYSKWDPSTTFIDPMTGSGTLAIEAAMIARGIPPGLIRKTYSFQNWPDYNRQLFQQIIDNIELSELRPQIFASDILPEMIEIARKNAQKALVSSYIRFSTQSFDEYKTKAKAGTLIMNPPYGERLKPEEINQLYSSIGTSLKREFQGYTAWIISSNLDAMKNIGLKPVAKYQLYNGGLQCNYAGFELFDGSLKEFKEKN
ncbi:MAG: RNA methyltransferase [Bacteroidota bacterium]|nr:MAG: RNA methyltransferase [Bacteroidota bacterium]